MIQYHIQQTETILAIKIADEYSVIEEQKEYAIGDTYHAASIRFSANDYDKIVKSALLFFKKIEYDPLNPSKHLDIIYYEKESEERNLRYSIYIDLQQKEVHYSYIDE
ncbi:hypothetical protein [Myroides sp. C20-1]